IRWPVVRLITSACGYATALACESQVASVLGTESTDTSSNDCAPTDADEDVAACERDYAECLRDAAKQVGECRSDCREATCVSGCDVSGVGEVRACRQRWLSCDR